MITYSRALRMGDFVRVGDVEGNVIHLGILSTKIKTLRNEDVTIPNAVVVAQTTTDYLAVRRERRRVRADVGHDRLRHAVAPGARAAARGGRAHGGHSARTEAASCSRPALEDFYVKYTLLVCLERQDTRPFVARCAAREHPGRVQRIRRADHVAELRVDPAAPKVVPKTELVRGAGRR